MHTKSINIAEGVAKLQDKYNVMFFVEIA